MDAIGQYADDVVARAWGGRPRLPPVRPGSGGPDRRRGLRGRVNARFDLARLALDETGMGVLEHKILKNAYATVLVYEDIRSRKTVGVIAHDQGAGISEVAQPKGPILATIRSTTRRRRRSSRR